MSAILAILNRDGQSVDRLLVERMLAARPEHADNGQDLWINGSVMLAHQHFWVTPEETGERQPIVNQSGTCILTCDARIDNRQELLLALDIPVSESTALSDAALVLKAYQRWGTRCVEHLLGDFAFVIWDTQEQHFFAARDGLGARNLCYYSDQRVCIIASEIVSIRTHPGVRSEINEVKIAESLAQVHDSQKETLFTNIYYCQPGYAVLASQSGFKTWQYWDIDASQRIRYRNDEEYAEHYLSLLTEAVRSRLRTNGPVGISLSGGWDSTSVAALASRMLPNALPSQTRLQSFSYVFDEFPECDEREYIQPLVERYHMQACYLPADDLWTLKNVEQWPVLHDFLISDALAWLNERVKEAAQQAGCRVLLTGGFADVLYQAYTFWLADMLTDLRFGKIFQEISRNRANFSWRRDFLENGLRQLIPVPVKKFYRHWKPIDILHIRPWLHPDLVKRTRLQDRIESDRRWKRFAMQSRWDFYRTLTAWYHSQSLGADRYLYHARGLELADPYYDRRLVEFVMAIPAEQLGRPWTFKKILYNAMQGLLPEVILSRNGKVTYYPLIAKGLLDKERHTVRSLLSAPRIVQDQFIQPDWLARELLAGDQWSRFGYNLWVSIVLELWLDRFG